MSDTIKLPSSGKTYQYEGNMDVDGTLEVGGIATFTAGQQSSGVASIATADGTGTGTITDGTSAVIVTSSNANYIITLPTPTPCTVVWLINGATGYELRSSAPSTIAINGGSASNAESAIPANTLVRMFCTAATTWVGTQFSTAGTESAVQVAAA